MHSAIELLFHKALDHVHRRTNSNSPPNRSLSPHSSTRARARARAGTATRRRRSTHSTARPTLRAGGCLRRLALQTAGRAQSRALGLSGCRSRHTAQTRDGALGVVRSRRDGSTSIAQARRNRTSCNRCACRNCATCVGRCSRESTSNVRGGC